MTFQEAVGVTKDVSDAWRPGLQALRRTDCARIECSDTRRLRGSLALDEALKGHQPHARRWDYGIATRADDETDQIAWVEVHDANAHHVDEVIEKLRWLKQWLSEAAPALAAPTTGSPAAGLRSGWAARRRTG